MFSESTRRTGLKQDRHNTKNVQLWRENIHFTYFARFDLISNKCVESKVFAQGGRADDHVTLNARFPHMEGLNGNKNTVYAFRQ